MSVPKFGVDSAKKMHNNTLYVITEITSNRCGDIEILNTDGMANTVKSSNAIFSTSAKTLNIEPASHKNGLNNPENNAHGEFTATLNHVG
jgi:hypothetical protein